MTFQVNPLQTFSARKYELRAQICQYLQRNVCQRGGGGGGGGGGGNRLLFKLLRKSIKQAHNLNQSTYCYSFTSISNKTEIN